MSKQKTIKTVVHLPTQELFDRFFEETAFPKPKACGCRCDQWSAYGHETCYDIEGKRLGNKRFFAANRDDVQYEAINFDLAMELKEHFNSIYIKSILVNDAVEQPAN